MTEYAPVMLGEEAPLGDAAQGVIVGADPLDLKDGDTAYVETYLTGSFESSMVSFRLPPSVTASPSARVTVEAEWRVTDTTTPGYTSSLVLSARPSGSEFSGSFVTFPPSAVGPYATTSVELDFAALPSRFSPDRLMSPDTVFHIQNNAITGDSATVRTTWLRFIVEGDAFIPLRQLHRDDGHGMTPPRAFGGASRIRTGRAYGYD